MMPRGLPRAKKLLPQVIAGESTDLLNVRAGLGKTQIDPNIKAAAAAAYQAALDAGAAQDDALQAANAAAAAQEDADLGVLAYGGDFSATGVIDSQYQDHGTGSNVLYYNHVDLGGNPYAAWTLWQAGALVTLAEVDFSNATSLGQDTWIWKADVGTFTPYRALFAYDSNFTVNQPYLHSIYVRSHNQFTGDPCLFQIRVREYPTQADADANTNAVTIATSSQFSVTTASGIVRVPLAFTPQTTGLIRLEYRVQRTSGTAGATVNAVRMWNPMAEPVMLGQSQPSKFTMPLIDPSTFPVRNLEGGVLRGYISGFDITKNAASGQTALLVSGGACYIPSSGRVISVVSQTSLIPTTTAGVRYIYAYETQPGLAALEVSTTGPDFPYFGTARTKNGDASRRLVGVVVIYGTALVPFRDENGYYSFQDNFNSRQLVTTATNVANVNLDLSPYMPNFARLAHLVVGAVYGTAGGSVMVGTTGVSDPATSGDGVLSITARVDLTRPRIPGAIMTDNLNRVNYAVQSTAVSINIWLLGFWYER